MSPSPHPPILTRLLNQHGFNHFGWTKLVRPLTIDQYHDWIQRGRAADMDYLVRQESLKEFPKQFRAFNSAIVIAVPYVPHPWPTQLFANNQIALYAQGEDYHSKVPQHLGPLLTDLQQHFAGEHFEIFTDSAPILERDLAYRAGLGWIGKNTCLIHPKKGSLFFLAEIYTSLVLENEVPWSSDFCGSCRQCITACPTQALTENRELIPSKCISYWTIEAKTNPPENLRSPIGDWLFGCDICQTVCPWNKKTLAKHHSTKPKAEDSFSESSRPLRIDELRLILESSRKSLQKSLTGSPMSRAAGWKLQRNAIIVAVNNHFIELIPSIAKWENDAKLGELVKWALLNLEPV